MNLLVWAYLAGTDDQIVDTTCATWDWVTPRGALVAKKRIFELLDEDLELVCQIHMRPIRTWISGAIRVVIAAELTDGTLCSTEMRLDSDLDPNFKVKDIIELNGWQQYYPWFSNESF